MRGANIRAMFRMRFLILLYASSVRSELFSHIIQIDCPTIEGASICDYIWLWRGYVCVCTLAFVWLPWQTLFFNPPHLSMLAGLPSQPGDRIETRKYPPKPHDRHTARGEILINQLPSLSSLEADRNKWCENWENFSEMANNCRNFGCLLLLLHEMAEKHKRLCSSNKSSRVLQFKLVCLGCRKRYCVIITHPLEIALNFAAKWCDGLGEHHKLWTRKRKGANWLMAAKRALYQSKIFYLMFFVSICIYS